MCPSSLKVYEKNAIIRTEWKLERSRNVGTSVNVYRNTVQKVGICVHFFVEFIIKLKCSTVTGGWHLQFPENLTCSSLCGHGKTGVTHLAVHRYKRSDFNKPYFQNDFYKYINIVSLAKRVFVCAV